MNNLVCGGRKSITILIVMLLLMSLPNVVRGQQSDGPDTSFQDWETASDVKSLGWSEEGLRALQDHVDSIGSASVLIVTDSKVVFSHGDLAKPYRAHSIRKSLLSALFGIAREAGEIDLSRTLGELKIEEKTPLTDSESQATVADLLKARSGVYLPAASETKEIREGRPQRGQHRPGDHWFYNNWDFNVLGTIYRQETGEDLFEAFAEQIAKPIGMEDFELKHTRYQLEEVSQHPSYKFRISTRDLARFGILFLNNGRWRGQEIIPAAWIEESTRAHSLTGSAGTKSGYGMMWWVVADPESGSRIPVEMGAYTASGTGGQRLTVLPSLNTVIVHRVDTDDKDGVKIGTSAYHRFLRQVMQARLESVGQNQ